MKLITILIKLLEGYLFIEDLWMSELYHEQKEYEKSHLLYPSN